MASNKFCRPISPVSGVPGPVDRSVPFKVHRHCILGFVATRTVFLQTTSSQSSPNHRAP